jgi:replicative DNA helicase
MELSDQVAEENVLGLIMTAPKEVVADIFSRITVDDLYYDGYRQFFTLLRNCYINGEETTIFAITNLHQSEFERIAKLCKTSPIALGTGRGNINYSSAMLEKSEDVIGILADRLAEKRRMRNLHDIETRIAKGLDKKESTWETFEAVEKMLIEKNVSSDKRSYLSPNDMANLMVESVSERMDKKKRNKEIIYTSYEQFNRRSGGLEKGNLVILSAGSGVGKSA